MQCLVMCASHQCLSALWNTVCNVRCVVNVVLLLRSWTSEVSLEQCDDEDMRWLFVTTRIE